MPLSLSLYIFLFLFLFQSLSLSVCFSLSSMEDSIVLVPQKQIFSKHCLVFVRQPPPTLFFPHSTNRISRVLRSTLRTRRPTTQLSLSLSLLSLSFKILVHVFSGSFSLSLSHRSIFISLFFFLSFIHQIITHHKENTHQPARSIGSRENVASGMRRELGWGVVRARELGQEKKARDLRTRGLVPA